MKLVTKTCILWDPKLLEPGSHYFWQKGDRGGREKMICEEASRTTPEADTVQPAQALADRHSWEGSYPAKSSSTCFVLLSKPGAAGPHSWPLALPPEPRGTRTQTLTYSVVGAGRAADVAVGRVSCSGPSGIAAMEETQLEAGVKLGRPLP